MNVSNFDLNLLAAFEAMFHERQVTRAAHRLGITQPAMSNALRRLRDLLGDPLFVRTSEGMSPTPRALALGPKIQAALAGLRDAVQASGFDPAGSAMRFTLATIDSLEAVYLPKLINRVEKAGPGIGLWIRRVDSLFQVPQQALETGVFDCALGLFPMPLPPQSSLLGQILGPEEWLCVARKGHPKVSGALSLPDYAALPQLAIAYPGSGEGGLIDRLLAERGLSRRVVAIVPHFLSLAHHVAESDCIATLPRPLAEIAARTLNLQIAEIVGLVPAVNISLIWHQRVDKDPAQVWFRAQVASCFAEGALPGS